MKRRNKRIACLLILALFLTAAGCGGGSSAIATQSGKAAEQQTSKHADTAAPAEPAATQAETEPPVTEPSYYLENYSITGFESPFSEGRAWVKYYWSNASNRTESAYALIDESGSVCMTSEKAGTPVSGGYTVIYRDDGFDIYDADGLQTYSVTDVPECQTTILGTGNGVFLLNEHISSFSDTGDFFSVIDGHGSNIGAFHAYGQPDSVIQEKLRGIWEEFKYLGEGIFYSPIDHDAVDMYNAVTNEYYCVSPYSGNGSLLRGISKFENGRAYGHFSEAGSGDLYYHEEVTPEAFKNIDTFFAWLDSAQPGRIVSTDWSDEFVYNEGFFVRRTGFLDSSTGKRIDDWAICNHDGDLIGYFPTYPAAVRIQSAGNYSGGFMWLVLTGADDFFYATLLDTEGKQVYEPVCLGKERKRSTWNMYENNISDELLYTQGNIYYRTASFTKQAGLNRIDPNGQVTSLDTVFQQLGDLRLADDRYLYFERGLTDLEGNILWSQICRKVDREDVPEPTHTQQAETQPAKSYINPSSYVIEGKWKSIGSYGFGQAQPGAIVTFDGVRCNLYSPADTYAFYKSGGKFILDCTSILSGTVTFTVKILDENHIDLYNGGYVTELMRIQ